MWTYGRLIIYFCQHCITTYGVHTHKLRMISPFFILFIYKQLLKSIILQLWTFLKSLYFINYVLLLHFKLFLSFFILILLIVGVFWSLRCLSRLINAFNLHLMQQVIMNAFQNWYFCACISLNCCLILLLLNFIKSIILYNAL